MNPYDAPPQTPTLSDGISSQKMEHVVFFIMFLFLTL